MHRKIIEFLSTVSGKITIIVVIGILAVAGIQTVRITHSSVSILSI